MRVLASFLMFAAGFGMARPLGISKHFRSPDEIRGAAIARDGRLFTWGDSLRIWEMATGKSRVLARGPFGQGGCLTDLDGDGREEFAGKEGSGLGRLTWRKPPDWRPLAMEAATDTHDCLEATLFGRKGVLTIHRFMQVRFYERGEPGKPWLVREIYSIYTPSLQAGLSLRDVDGDGVTDIVCGNYWIQSPKRFELPWHIFAIDTWFEERASAMHAHTFFGETLFVAQTHMADARAAMFRKPADPRQLWLESRIAGEFQRVHAVAVWDDRIVFGENNGAASRLFELHGGEARKIAGGIASLRLFATSQGLVSVGPREFILWQR